MGVLKEGVLRSLPEAEGGSIWDVPKGGVVWSDVIRGDDVIGGVAAYLLLKEGVPKPLFAAEGIPMEEVVV